MISQAGDGGAAVRAVGVPRLLAGDIGFAEGPAVLPDGRVVFVEIYRSRVAVWSPMDGVSTYANTGGGPQACALGSDGVVYVTQNGGTLGPWLAEVQVPPSIQMIASDGATPEIVVTEVDGHRLSGPNDLVFGPDERLYFTDPGAYLPKRPDPSRIFVLNKDGSGHLLFESQLPSFPNGIAVESDGSVLWTESFVGKVRRLRPGQSTPEDVGLLHGRRPTPDGMAVAADGSLLVTSVTEAGIDVFTPDGRLAGFIQVGAVPTNCCFGGTDLYVTDAGVVANRRGASFNGALWRIRLDVEGLPPWAGRIEPRSA
jgi:gluconolactonase